MKRLHLLSLLFCCSLLVLSSCAKDQSTSESEFRVELTSVGGTRARITVASMNKKAYYSFVQLSPQEEDFSVPAATAVAHAIEFMEESYQYYEKGSFTDVFCYQGSRQLSITSIRSDAQYRFIIFQLHPRTHTLIGDPVEISYRTKPVPVRDLTFAVAVDGEKISVTPSDPTLTYFWDYEASAIIEDDYFFPQSYLYNLVGVYDEYGFLESELSQELDFWYFSDDNKLKADEEYTLVIAGCEDAEFTTPPMQLRFVWHGAGNVEVIEELRPCSIDY